MRDNNNFFDFMEAEDYIRLKADACVSSKDLYTIYKMWCEENNLVALKARSFSDAVIANLKKYNLEHTNNIANSAGRRVWGYLGIEGTLYGLRCLLPPGDKTVYGRTWPFRYVRMYEARTDASGERLQRA